MGPRYGRYIAVLGLIALVAIALNTALTRPNDAKGIAVGNRVPPFAAPLARGWKPGRA